MKAKLLNRLSLVTIFLILGMVAIGQAQTQKKKDKKDTSQKDNLFTNPDGLGLELIIEFMNGESHNHPSLAIWIEDTEGNFVQNLYVSESVATGVFNYGTEENGQWTKGEARRPASLPYWSHKQGILAEDGLYMPKPSNPVPDAYTGATPKNNFTLLTKLDQNGPDKFHVLLEINQPWDWNEYWTNAKYPDDYEYKTSSQPAVIYMAIIDLLTGEESFEMELIGHSHYSGQDGELYEDIATLTTATEIAEKITVRTK